MEIYPFFGLAGWCLVGGIMCVCYFYEIVLCMRYVDIVFSESENYIFVISINKGHTVVELLSSLKSSIYFRFSTSNPLPYNNRPIRTHS